MGPKFKDQIVFIGVSIVALGTILALYSANSRKPLSIAGVDARVPRICAVAAGLRGRQPTRLVAHRAADTLEDAKTNLMIAQAQADYWQADLVREKRLADSGAIPQSEYESEQVQVMRTLAAVRAASVRFIRVKAGTR